MDNMFWNWVEWQAEASHPVRETRCTCLHCPWKISAISYHISQSDRTKLVASMWPACTSYQHPVSVGGICEKQTPLY